MRGWMLSGLVWALLALPGCASTPLAPMDGRLIDMHFHALATGRSDADKVARRDARLAEMAPLALARSTYLVNDLGEYAHATDPRLLVGVTFPCPRNLAAPFYYCWGDSDGWPDIAWLEQEARAGRVRVLGELMLNYAGVRADDPRLEPYWALAARYDLPVLVHTMRGPGPLEPGTLRDANCCPDYDEQAGNPAHLRPVLARHPDLRISLMHLYTDGLDPDGFTEEGVALMRDFPNVYADMTIVNAFAGPDLHRQALLHAREAGILDRIMFGTDNLPAAPIIAELDAFDFLTPAERAGLYRDNAMRFLGSALR